VKRRVIALAFVALFAPTPASSQAPAEEERPLEGAALPTDPSPVPKPAEWPAAPRVRVTRRGPAAAGCRAYLLREWLRVRCPGEAFALSLLGGDSDVAFWIDPASREGEVLVPLRPGSKHVVQLWKAGKDAAGVFVPEPLVVLQQHWLAGAPAPVVTLF
jgi:hypothetical protein